MITKSTTDQYKKAVMGKLNTVKVLINESQEEPLEEGTVDTITLDIPLFIRMLEYSREDASQDLDLHVITARANELNKEKEVLTVEDYDKIINNTEEIEEEIVTDDPEKAKDISDKTGEPVKLVKKGTLQENHRYDYEGNTARTQLYSIIINAKTLFDQIDNKTQLQSWVQSKLTKAEDYIDAVRTYLEGESLSNTAPAMNGGEVMKDDEGATLKVGDVVKAADGKIYQVIFSYSEGKPFLTPFDLKKRRPISLRERHYFDTTNESGMSPTVKMIKVMEYSATKGGFIK